MASLTNIVMTMIEKPYEYGTCAASRPLSMTLRKDSKESVKMDMNPPFLAAVSAAAAAASAATEGSASAKKAAVVR